jgi:hypothetical protein
MEHLILSKSSNSWFLLIAIKYFFKVQN